ncbi:MAG: helix-turn-helix domain-containing protein [Gammaproteobacteria bacterium]
MSIFTETATMTESVDLANKYPFGQHVKDIFKKYVASLQGEKPSELYELFLGEFEKPFLESVLEYTRHNQSKAAIILGLSRGTLRKKLKQYGLL